MAATAKYKIISGSNNIFDNIKIYCQEDATRTNPEILDMIKNNTIMNNDTPPKNKVEEKFKLLFGYLVAIDEIKKDDAGLNINNTQVNKIHFLAAAICQRFVEACFIKLGTSWDGVNAIVKKIELTYKTTGISNFYINPPANGAGYDFKNILMYQLLLQLIANDMKPNIDVVLDFLSKIDSSWCFDEDLKEATAEYEELKIIPNVDGQIADCWNKIRKILRPLRRLKAARISDDAKQAAVNELIKKIDDHTKAIKFAETTDKLIKEFGGKAGNIQTEIKNIIRIFNAKGQFPNIGGGTIDYDSSLPIRFSLLANIGLIKFIEDLGNFTKLKIKIDKINLNDFKDNLTPAVKSYLETLTPQVEGILKDLKSALEGNHPNNYLTLLQNLTISIAFAPVTNEMSRNITAFNALVLKN